MPRLISQGLAIQFWAICCLLQSRSAEMRPAGACAASHVEISACWSRLSALGDHGTCELPFFFFFPPLPVTEASTEPIWQTDAQRGACVSALHAETPRHSTSHAPARSTLEQVENTLPVFADKERARHKASWERL